MARKEVREMAKKIMPTYDQIKELARKGLNVNQSAKKLGCTRKEIMKVIKENV
jgi:biotin operon repressor